MRRRGRDQEIAAAISALCQLRSSDARGVLGTITVKQEDGEQSSGPSLIGPRELAITTVGDRHGHAGFVDAEPCSHRRERAVGAMIGAGQQSGASGVACGRRATWSGGRRDSSRLAPIMTGPFAAGWKLMKTRHMRLNPRRAVRHR